MWCTIVISIILISILFKSTWDNYKTTPCGNCLAFDNDGLKLLRKFTVCLALSAVLTMWISCVDCPNRSSDNSKNQALFLTSILQIGQLWFREESDCTGFFRNDKGLGSHYF